MQNSPDIDHGDLTGPGRFGLGLFQYNISKQFRHFGIGEQIVTRRRAAFGGGVASAAPTISSQAMILAMNAVEVARGRR